MDNSIAILLSESLSRKNVLVVRMSDGVPDRLNETLIGERVKVCAIFGAVSIARLVKTTEKIGLCMRMVFTYIPLFFGHKCNLGVILISTALYYK